MKKGLKYILPVLALVLVLGGSFYTVGEQRLDALTYNALKTVMGTLAQSDIINMNAVYSRMISERNQMAEKYTADGNYDASIIRNDVDKQVNIAVSNAKAQAAELEAQGEAEYMRLLAEAYDTPEKQEFYRFTLALDALKQSLDGSEKTVILDGDSELAQILTGIG